MRSVACGAYQTAAVTRAGELFCWGWQFEDGPSGSIQEHAPRSKWPRGGRATAHCPGRLALSLGLPLQALRGASHSKRAARPLEAQLAASAALGPPKPPTLCLATAQEGYTCVPRRMVYRPVISALRVGEQMGCT